MYIPALNAETDVRRLHTLMQTYNFGLLVSGGTPAPQATHLPFLVDTQAGEQGTLVAHLARANPHWKQLDPQEEVLVIFQGAHSYISPRWYAEPSVVPTWNYAAVHAYGKPRLIHDEAALRKMVVDLVEYHEGPDGLPTLEADLPDNLLKAIVGLEIPITRLEGKFKYSQNKTPADQQGVIEALSQSADTMQQAVADIMRQNLAQPRRG